MDGKIWMDGCIERCMDGNMYMFIYGSLDRNMDECTERRMDVWKDIWEDDFKDVWMDGKIYGCMH